MDKGGHHLLNAGALFIPMLLWGNIALAAEQREALENEERIGAEISFMPLPHAPQCPDEADFRLQMQLRLGYDPFEPGASLRLKLKTARRAGRIVTIVDAEGGEEVVYKRREFELADTPRACWDGMLYAASSLSLFFLPPPKPQPPPPPCPEVPAAPPPAAAKRPEPAPLDTAAPAPQRAASARAAEPSPAARQIQLSLASVGEIAGTPQASLGAAFGLLVRHWPSFSLGVEVRGFLPTATEATNGSSFNITRAMGGMTACWYWDRNIFFVCPVAELGVVRLNGELVKRAAEQISLGLGGRLGAEILLSNRWALRLHADALVRPIMATVSTNAHHPIGSTSLGAVDFGVGFARSL